MEDKVLETIKKYNLINEGDKVVLAVSGGPDSMCMLRILSKIRENGNKLNSMQILNHKKICQEDSPNIAKFDIVVAHVNHLIREEAKQDEKYVKDYCQKNQIEFYSKSIDVEKLANNNKIGLEEAGRLARYEFFEEVLKKVNGDKIAIAHNRNDKVETIIMNILRGSGIAGLKGIEPKREIYIRPLIECERYEIEEYCKKENLEPRIDKTNFENKYTRNKIRNIVIPYIKEEFNPNIVETIDRLSSIVDEEENFIQKQVETEYLKVLEEENENTIILDLKKFNKLEKVIKSRILLYTITKLFGTTKGIEKIHIEDILKLCSNNIGNKYLTPNKNTKILVKNQKIYISINL